MSDVIVSTTESTTDVTTTNDVTTVAITDTTVEVSQATAGFQGVPGSNSDPTYVFVRNSTGALLPKGSIVYVSGANGVHTQISLALATGDVTSARTLGWLAEDIANNASGLCCVEGYLDGVNTQGITEGAQLYLSPTVAGGFTQTKPSAPDHMVYVGIAAKASAGNGRVFVHIQNGAELEELHDVKIVSPQNNDLLRYVSGTALWENVASTAITAGSAITAGTAYFASLSGTATTISGSITKSQVSDFTSGTVTSASTAQQAGTAFFASTASTADYATTSGTSVYSANSGTAVTISGTITNSQVSDFTSGTVASASTALTAGTASFASQAGTAVYSDTSGTAVTISGSITRSQVSDYASGTVANISGTVTQAQVSGLGSALAGKAGLADNNTFTGTNTFSNFTTFQAASDAIPIRIFGANGQSADLFSVNDYLTNTQFEILSDGRAQSLKGIIATVSGTASIPLVVRGTAGQSANLLQIETATATAISATSAGNLNATGQVRVGTTSGLGQLAVVSTGTATIGAVIRGASGQTANLLEIQNSGSTALSYIRSTGALYFNSNNNTTGIEFLGTSGTQYITANGNDFSLRPRFDTLFAPADTSGRFRPTNDNTSDLGTSGQRWKIVYSSGASIVNSGTALVPLTVRGASGQSANLQEWQNNTGGTVVRVESSGKLVGGQNITALGSIHSYNIITSGSNEAQYGAATLSIGTRGTANPGVIVRGVASQSANLQEWQDSAGGTVAYIAPTGFLNINNASLRINTAGASFNARINVATDGTAVIGQVIRGAPSQSANLQEWQTSSGSTAVWVTSGGLIRVQGDPGGMIGVITANSTLRGVVVRGVASQSVDLIQVQNDTGGTTVRMAMNGQSTFGGTATLGQVTVLPASTATVGVVVQGLSGQSANLQTWQNSGGTVLASIGTTGDVTAPAFRTTNDYVVTGQLQNGGSIRMQKADAASAPPSNQVRIMVLAGTNANTLKLVAIGPNGSAVTILDNLA